MRRKVLIVGGGPGGCMTANRLVKALKREARDDKVEITLLSARDRHVYEAGYLFMALDLKKEESFVRSQADVLLPGVNLVVDPATAIDLSKKKVRGRSGRDYGYDYLLIATGSEIRPDITPGLKDGGNDFFTSDGTRALREILTRCDGGRILCAVEMPHKCPVAYLEILLMLDDYYRQKGIREKVDLAFTNPAEGVHMMKPIADFAAPILDQKGIHYHTAFALERVDPAARKAFSRDGRAIDYDILITIPTHRAPKVILDSGLGDAQGWIKTDPLTLKMAGADNVYIIGDATNLHTQKVSKAGSAAHYQSEVISHNLVQELHGQPPNRFYDGKVFCFIETSLSQATCVQMNYQKPPNPAPPSTLLHWFKLSFNELYWAAARGIF